MTNFYKKSRKSYFWSILSPQIWAKTNFPGKKELSQFLDIPIKYHRAKNQKKLMSHFWKKHQTGRWMDRRTDGWTDG